MRCQPLLHKKWSFPLRIFSVNVIKSAIFWEFGHIYWGNPQWKTQEFPFFVVYYFMSLVLPKTDLFPVYNIYIYIFLVLRKWKSGFFSSITAPITEQNLLFFKFNKRLRTDKQLFASHYGFYLKMRITEAILVNEIFLRMYSIFLNTVHFI